ncbi:hypothetical protein [Hymenobacter sp. B1770]|uniref:hypothetical protein n=1 Tax=Hymenobacter sp. B1770 TaxID=1718788 RepID=UPI003CEAA764
MKNLLHRTLLLGGLLLLHSMHPLRLVALPQPDAIQRPVTRGAGVGGQETASGRATAKGDSCITIVNELSTIQVGYNDPLKVRNSCNRPFYGKIRLEVFDPKTSRWERLLYDASERVQPPPMEEYGYVRIDAQASRVFALYVPPTVVKRHKKGRFRLRVDGTDGSDNKLSALFISPSFAIAASSK